MRHHDNQYIHYTYLLNYFVTWIRSITQIYIFLVLNMQYVHCTRTMYNLLNKTRTTY